MQILKPLFVFLVSVIQSSPVYMTICHGNLRKISGRLMLLTTKTSPDLFGGVLVSKYGVDLPTLTWTFELGGLCGTGDYA